MYALKLFALFVLIMSVSAYRAQLGRLRLKKSFALSMSDEETSAKVTMTESDNTDDSGVFDMNKRVRLGRSRDQDGKSNIWSIEPSMQVEDDEDQTKKNLGIAAAVIATAVGVLPLFSAFSKFFPDPSDF